MADINKPQDPIKPDLDDSHNVTAAHGNLQGTAAASRESRLRENGTEPVSIWVFLLFSVALLVGGGVLHSAGSFMGYGELIQEGYLRAKAPGGDGDVIPTATALEAYKKKGSNIYSSKCGGCHQAGGEGVAGAYPPLANSEWVTGSNSLAAAVILHGLTGPITVSGTGYNSQMPSQASGLTAEDVAGVMTYIRNSFGNSTGDIVTIEMAQAALDQAEERGEGQVTADILKAEFDKPLPGTPLDPNTIVNKITLEPVDAPAE